MMLFVFEGKCREITLFKTMEQLFFPDEKERIICSFENNIYNLYTEMQKADFTLDLLSILQKKQKNNIDHIIHSVEKRSDIAEIFLFFDYDCQNNRKNSVTENILQEMLAFFSDETENGKLYINYPMVEAIRYTKKLPDSDYTNYTIALSECKDFKQCANTFSDYKNLDFIAFKMNAKTQQLKIASNTMKTTIEKNWQAVKEQNIKKAHFICTGNKSIPQNKEVVNQKNIFSNQLKKYVSELNSIAVLHSYPLFLFEYFE